MESHKATTTFKIVEQELTEAEYLAKLTEVHRSAGWFKGEPNEGFKKAIAEEFGELKEVTVALPLDVVLEKRGNVIQVRKMK